MNSLKPNKVKLSLSLLSIGCIGFALGVGLKLFTNWGDSSKTKNQEQAAKQIKKNPASPPPETGKNELFEKLNRLGAHPEDPSKPEGLVGQSDTDLASISLMDAGELLEIVESDGVPNSLDKARVLFQLGRIAQHHGMHDRAVAYFEAAASSGNAAALAYLGDLEPDPEIALALYQKAAQGGFTPAEAWRDQLIEQTQQAEAATTQNLDWSIFSEPILVQALYEEDMEFLDDNSRHTIVYLQGFQELMMDPSIAFRLQNGAQFSFEKDVNLDYNLTLRYLNDPKAMSEQVEVGVERLTSFLSAIVESREKGASITQEVQSGMQALIPNDMVPLDTIRARGKEDALRLALMYDNNPEFLRKVYGGAKRFASRN